MMRLKRANGESEASAKALTRMTWLRSLQNVQRCAEAALVGLTALRSL